MLWSIVGWAVCAPVAYLLYKNDIKRTLSWKKNWTNADRLLGLFVALFGPISVLVGLVLFATNRFFDKEWAKKETKW